MSTSELVSSATVDSKEGSPEPPVSASETGSSASPACSSVSDSSPAALVSCESSFHAEAPIIALAPPITDSAFVTDGKNEIIRGRVQWFSTDKGYGYLVSESGSDIFVHQTNIHSKGKFRSLQEGEPVEFRIGQDTTGRRKAVDVTGPDGAFVQGSRRRYSKAKSVKYAT
jgi:cold shock CspA family protein